MKILSKRYKEASSKIEKGKVYDKDEALNLLKETSTTKFDSTVEVSVRLNLDTKKADQQLRGALVLPKGTGKTKRTLVICNASKFEDAKASGTDFYGDKEMIEKIEKENFFDYDVIIATPDMMPHLGKIGKILGPKGLMPNPKTGTVTMDVAQAVNNAKSGQVNFRVDKQGNIHAGLGKVNFTKEQLSENISTFIKAINKHKPAAAKGRYVKNASLSLTMSPSISLDTQEVMDLK